MGVTCARAMCVGVVRGTDASAPRLRVGDGEGRTLGQAGRRVSWPWAGRGGQLPGCSLARVGWVDVVCAALALSLGFAWLAASSSRVSVPYRAMLRETPEAFVCLLVSLWVSCCVPSKDDWVKKEH